MSSTKKPLIMSPAARDEINTKNNDWLIELTQETCNHMNTSAYRLETFKDGWIHDLVKCADCELVFDAWYSPDSAIPNSSRENLIGYAEGIPEERTDHV